MKVIKRDAELRQLCNAGEGFIYNDFSRMGSSGKKYNVLHVASCRWLARSNANVPKIFFDTMEEAVDWLQENRGKEGRNWKWCGTCQIAHTSRRVS